MYAVIETGGKQYRVSKDVVIKVEHLEGEVGQPVEFKKVLAIHNEHQLTLDADKLSSVLVRAEILEQKKSDKVIVFKKKPRHNYRRKRGHRQQITVLKITDIQI